MKDFIDFLKLPPNILGALSIASGALLLLPDQLAKRLYMTEFRDKYGFTIGIIFVVSTAISKGVMWYRRNANLYRQSWEIQRG